jgi:threonylcarbamoyladenosine tRNA methylthiotransferase MtaB
MKWTSLIHVFKYSERDNTEAAKMLGVVPENVRVKRSKMMRGYRLKNALFYESQLGS